MSAYQSYFDELSHSSKNKKAHTEEPNWMMAIGKGEDQYLTSSSISEEASSTLTHFCFIHDYRFSMNRGIEAAASHTIKPDGGLTAQDLQVVVPSSSINANINLYFFENKELPTVQLARVGVVGNKLDILEEYTFSTCFVSGIVTKGDILAVSFRYGSVSRKNIHLSQKGVKGVKHVI